MLLILHNLKHLVLGLQGNCTALNTQEEEEEEEKEKEEEEEEEEVG